MIIGDHVIVCFHRALDNQVYAAGVSVARDVSWAHVSWALVSYVSLSTLASLW